MAPPVQRFSAVFAGFFLVMATLQLFLEFTRRKDIWWTPHAMMVPLAHSGDRVEIYARGRPLGALLEARRLRIADDAGSSVLALGEVGLRFNNWHRVRAERMPVLVAYAAGAGAAAVLLLMVLTGRLVYRPERQPVGS